MADEKEYFFIDANRAYRGPVTKSTLRHLFSTQSISPSTYVFSEHLEECNKTWMRLKRLPILLSELQQPADDAGATKALSELTVVDEKPPAPAPATQTTAAAAEPELEPVVEQSVVEPEVSEPFEPVTKDPLFHYFPAAGAAAPATSGRGSASSERKSGGGGFSLFGGKKKGSTTKEPASKSDFGQPLHLCTLDANGVPKVLSDLRATLFSQNGHLVEGIFRVSPSITGLKAAREQADAGKITSLTDSESIATLVKHWFRELPESIFVPRLEPIADGPPESGAACAAIVDGMPEPQRSTMRWLMQLFRDIAKHEDENRMTSKSLSVVFAPNLVDPPPTMPPLLSLELNGRIVTFLERLYHECAMREARNQPEVS